MGELSEAGAAGLVENEDYGQLQEEKEGVDSAFDTRAGARRCFFGARLDGWPCRVEILVKVPPWGAVVPLYGDKGGTWW